MFQLSVLFPSLFLLMVATAYADVQVIMPDNALSGSRKQGQLRLHDVEREDRAGVRNGDVDEDSLRNDGNNSNSPREETRTISSGPISIQHHLLPAETIPLPLTISTRPGLRTVIAPETITIQEPTVAKVGELVQEIPTAVSHQSSTVVHNHADLVTPILAPAVRTISSQVVRAYHTPLIYAAEIPVLIQS